MDEKKDILTSYNPPGVFKELDDIVGPDVVLAFRDGLVLFHSKVISRSSEKMRDFFTIKSCNPFRLDLRHLHRIHGAIVKKLLYEGLMHEAVDPVKSNVNFDERIQLLLRSKEIIESLGLTCILGTINSWIETVSGVIHVKPAEDSKTVSSSPETHSIETISSDSSDSLASSPLTDLTHDFKYESKVTNLPPKDDDDMTEDCDSATNCDSDEPQSPTPVREYKQTIPESSDEEAFLDQPEGSCSESEESTFSTQIKLEPTDVPKPDIPVGSLRSPSPVSHFL